MTDNQFDKFIKQKLEHYESQVPLGLWEKIMPEEERKPKAIWWNKTLLLLLLLLGTGISTYYLITKNNNYSFTINKKDTEFSKEVNSKQQSINNQISSLTDENLVANNNEVKVEVQEKNNSSLSINKTNLNGDESNSTNSFQQNDVIETNNNISANNLLIKNKSTKLFNKHINSAKNSSKPQSRITSVNPNSKYFDNGILSKKNKEAITNNFTIGNPGIDETVNVNSNYTPGDYKTINSLSFLEQNKNTNKSTLENSNKLFAGIEDCPSTKGVIRNDLYIEGYASVDYTGKKLISAQGGLDAYVTQKDSIEILHGGFTAGVRLSKSLSNNLLAKVGIQYSQVNENFTFRTENERKQVTTVTTHTIVRPGLPDTLISDTSTYIQIGYREQSHTNYYRNVEIPISLAYEFNSAENSNWKFAVNAGAIINIYSFNIGKTIDTTNKMVTINSKSSNSYYRESLALSLFGSLSIIRKINANVDVFAEPYYRFNVTNLEGIDGINKKFNAFGLQIGTRIKLNSQKKF